MIYTLTPAEGCFPGVHRHLSELGQFGTEHIYLKDLGRVTEDDSIIFGAWDPNTYPMVLRRCKARKKAVLFTSPLLQAQMNDPELCFLDSILTLKGHGVIDMVLFADLEAYEVFKDEPSVYHLPHPADPKKIECHIPQDKNNTAVQKIGAVPGVFMYLPWGNKNKNQVTQLAAVKLFQRENQDVMLYTNGMGPWSIWADKFSLNYKDQGYLPRDDYYASIFSNKCGLHVTLSESFAYGVLDAFILGVPVVCSPAIDWAPESLIVSNPDDPVEIADRLDDVYWGNTTSYGKAAKRFALQQIHLNNEKAKQILETIFS